MLAFILIVAMLALTLLTMYVLVHFVEGQNPKVKENLLEEARNDKCLEIEINVIPSKDFSLTYWFSFASLVIMFIGIVAVCSALYSQTDGDDTIIVLAMGMSMILIGVVFFYFASPFKRKGTLIISSKLVILPTWTNRPGAMKPHIFRLENVEKVMVERKSFQKKRITGISFEGKVFGKMALSKQDYGKYDEILRYLKELGIAIADNEVR